MFNNYQSGQVRIWLLVSALVLVGSLLGQTSPARAADTCKDDTKISFVILDPSGSFISNARVDIYEQTTDFYNNPKPNLNKHFAGGTTDAVLGTAVLTWRNSLGSDTYAIKIQTVGKDSASFWYYGNDFGCGDIKTISKKLSGVAFILRDANGNPLTNTSFNVYSEQVDTNKKPLKLYKELMTSLSSGASGQVKVYLPQGSLRSLDGTGVDNYALELSRNNSKFIYYNIAVKDEQLTTVNYYLSSLRVSLQDASGAVFPSGTNVDVFKQIVGTDNTRQKGDRVGSFTINSDGYGSMDISAGTYVLGVKGQSSVAQYFWDVKVLDGQSNEQVLTAAQVNTPVSTTCQNNSKLNLILRNASGDLLPGLKFEVYEQSADANGTPFAGSRVGGGTLDSSGKAVASFVPDPRKTYALKVWDKRSDLGDFWFFDAARFVCDYDRSVTKYLPALKIVLRDSKGKLKTNYSFALYAQEYDADNQPFFQSSDLIANLKTDAAGKSLVYVASYNPYRHGQTGTYALSLKDASGNVTNVYNIKTPLDKDYVFNYTFASLGGELRNAQKKILSGKEVRLYEQLTDGGQKTLGNQLINMKTDQKGKFQFDYAAGTYALAILDDFNQENIFWNIVIKGGQANVKNLVANTVKFSLSSLPITENSNNLTLKLYKLVTEGDRKYYRDAEVGNVKLASNKMAFYSLGAGYYLVVYKDKVGKEYGRAFAAVNGQLQTVALSVTSKMRVSATQTFKF
jgi:hypothetical protein